MCPGISTASCHWRLSLEVTQEASVMTEGGFPQSSFQSASSREKYVWTLWNSFPNPVWSHLLIRNLDHKLYTLQPIDPRILCMAHLLLAGFFVCLFVLRKSMKPLWTLVSYCRDGWFWSSQRDGWALGISDRNHWKEPQDWIQRSSLAVNAFPDWATLLVQI